jgi:hypothetical protein
VAEIQTSSTCLRRKAWFQRKFRNSHIAHLCNVKDKAASCDTFSIASQFPALSAKAFSLLAGVLI